MLVALLLGGAFPLLPTAEGDTATVIGQLPASRAHASAAVVDGLVYVLGGSSHVYHKAIVRYDPATGVVSTMAGTLPTGRHLAPAASDGATIYMFGGWGGGQYHASASA